MPTPVHPQCPDAPRVARRTGMSDPRMGQRRPLLLLYPFLPNLPEGKLGGHAAARLMLSGPILSPDAAVRCGALLLGLLLRVVVPANVLTTRGTICVV